MKVTKKAKRELKKYLVYSSIVLAILFIFIITNTDIVSVLITLLLITAASLSKIYKRITSLSIGFELVTLATILFAFKIGIVFAIVASLFMLIASEFISGKILPQALAFHVIAYVIIAIVAGVFISTGNFLQWAIILIIFRNVFLFASGVFVGGDVFKLFLGTFPNIFINWFIVSKIGLFLASLL